jgi:hypothetical protein
MNRPDARRYLRLDVLAKSRLTLITTKTDTETAPALAKGNRQINRVIHTMANVQLRHAPKAARTSTGARPTARFPANSRAASNDDSRPRLPAHGSNLRCGPESGAVEVELPRKVTGSRFPVSRGGTPSLSWTEDSSSPLRRCSSTVVRVGQRSLLESGAGSPRSRIVRVYSAHWAQPGRTHRPDSGSLDASRNFSST